jgi:WD40 repeat protein
VPKVIDFGLAKALSSPTLLTERTLHTAYGTVLGTPLYMAPEQVGINALDVDTPSDVYSLGVVLYELLTGSTPLEKARLKEMLWDEVKRLIREAEPPPPSARLSSGAGLAGLAACRQVGPEQLPRLVRGELDWIVMKALEKDRPRRYDSASGLAADVRRHLSGEPVQAAPPSAGYLLQKFVMRNLAAVLTAATFTVVVLVAAGVSVAFGLMAVRAEGIAEKRRRDAETNETRALEAEDELWASLYAARWPRIHGAWDIGNYSRVRELLAAQVPTGGRRDHRGFEWYYLDRQINADLRTVVISPKKVSDEIAASANGLPLWRLSPDGTRLLLSGWSNGEYWLQSYDTTTGRDQFTVRYKGEATGGASYSQDGKWIVATDYTDPEYGKLRRWNAATGQEDHRARSIGRVGMPLAGPDSLPAVWLGGLWDGKAGKARAAPWGDAFVLALSYDGKLLALDKGAGVVVVEPHTGKPPPNADGPPIPLRKIKGLTDPRTTPAAFSVDGKRLVVAGEKLTVWEVAPRRKLAEVAEQVRRPVFSPDGGRIAYVRGPDAVIAEAATGRVRRTIKGHDGGIEFVAFTRDGSVLVTASADLVKHWDATLDERVPALKDGGASPSSNGRLAGLFKDQEIKAWGLGKGPLFTFKVPPLPALAIKIKREPEIDNIPMGHVDVRCVFSPDGQRVAVAGATSYGFNRVRVDQEDAWESEFRLCDLDAGRQLMGIKRLGKVSERAFSPDGRFLVALFDPPGEAMVWDAATGRHRYTVKFPVGHNFVFAFSPDSSRVAAVGGGKAGFVVALWDAETGRRLPAASLPFGKEQRWYRLGWFSPALGPKDKRIAAFVRKDTVSVWDTETGGHVVELKGTKGLAPNTTLLAFSPDGRRLATFGRGGGLKIWDPDTGAELLSLQVPVKAVGPGSADGLEEADLRVYHLAFTPDGHSIRLVVRTEAGFETRLLDGRPRPGAP